MKKLWFIAAGAALLCFACCNDRQGGVPGPITTGEDCIVSTRGNVIRQAMAKQALGGADAYVYLSAWKSLVNDGALAACHGMELPFMFDNVSQLKKNHDKALLAY